VADATAVFGQLDREAAERVRAIIAANEGRAAPRVARRPAPAALAVR
jgi:hypothetical protein